MKISSVSKATLGRLPQYLKLLRQLDCGSGEYISATVIAKHLSLGEVQVRKDLAAVSGQGKPKRGYLAGELISALERQLGQECLTAAVLVGAGKLGRALLEYGGFEPYGLKILAGFDVIRHLPTVGGRAEILPIDSFESFCLENSVRIGIITVGEGSAQEICDLMVKCGIRAIWNFAPCKLNAPSDVILRNENLALSLAHLRSQLASGEDK